MSNKDKDDNPNDRTELGEEEMATTKGREIKDEVGDLVMDDEEYAPDQIKKIKQRLKTCETERQEYLEGWQRARADYVNLKMSEEKAKHEIGKRAEARLILDFLKVADSFDLAISNRESWAKLPDNWRQGMEYVHSQLKTALQDNGVKEINPLQQKFDPQKAHSIGVVKTADEKMDNVVLEVLKIGYELHGQVIRPAQVKVGSFEAAGS